MQGSLIKYGPRSAHVAFVTGESTKHFILVGGLGDGLLFAPYASALNDFLVGNGWSLVQPLLSSSHQGYGVSSLDKDAEELNLLAKHLTETRNSKALVIMGHSTGCQDAVRYAAQYGRSAEAAPVLGYILQAPVSDREAFTLTPTPDDVKEERLVAAQLMESNGEGEEILFRDPQMEGAPVCARRYVSLVSKGGDDDLFSSDFTDSELKEKLQGLASAPSLLIMGGADEFVPSTVDKDLLVKRMAAAVGAGCKGVVVPSGKHNLKGSEQEVVKLVADFLSGLQT